MHSKVKMLDVKYQVPIWRLEAPNKLTTQICPVTIEHGKASNLQKIIVNKKTRRVAQEFDRTKELHGAELKINFLGGPT